MPQINTSNYPNIPATSYGANDMLLYQKDGGETRTTKPSDIKAYTNGAMQSGEYISGQNVGADLKALDTALKTASDKTVKIGMPVTGEYTDEANTNAQNIKALDDQVKINSDAQGEMSHSKLDQSSIAPEWSAGTYASGTRVTHNGKYWKALADTSDEPTALSADWALEDDIDTQIADIKAAIVEIPYNVIADGAGAHNAIYRGKYLGTSVTAEQYAAIADGTFKDLFIGDYWIINGVTWRIAAFDYWYNIAGDNIDVHHVVIVPDEALATCQMNSTNITTGGYVGSDFYTGAHSNTGRATAISAVNSAFGAAHILHYHDYLINAVTDGHPSGQVWQECTVELMNEAMVYGGKFFEPMANGSAIYSNYTVSKSQLPLFQHDHSRICNRAGWWLRGVVSSSFFARVDAIGSAYYNYASGSSGVRPAFAIRA